MAAVFGPVSIQVFQLLNIAVIIYHNRTLLKNILQFENLIGMNGKHTYAYIETGK